MKYKPLIPFRILDKYKYFYFAVSSLMMAVIVVFLDELTNEVSDFALRHLMHSVYSLWGFFYPASFAIYEAARKQNKKLLQ